MIDRKRAPHKRPNRDPSTIDQTGLQKRWADDHDPNKPKTASFPSLRVDAEFLEAFTDACDRIGKPRTTAMREALAEYLAKIDQ